MIITISGAAGTGKSTVSKMVAEQLGYEHYSTGDFMREMAAERGVTIVELNQMAEEDASLDKELDDRHVSLGEKKDNFVIDGRLSWHFIPKSFKVLLTASMDVRAKRILADKIRKELNNSIENVKSDIIKRETSEKIRYKELYGVNPYDLDHYDLVVDTDDKTPQEIVDIILKKVKK